MENAAVMFQGLFRSRKARQRVARKRTMFIVKKGLEDRIANLEIIRLKQQSTIERVKQAAESKLLEEKQLHKEELGQITTQLDRAETEREGAIIQLRELENLRMTEMRQLEVLREKERKREEARAREEARERGARFIQRVVRLKVCRMRIRQKVRQRNLSSARISNAIMVSIAWKRVSKLRSELIEARACVRLQSLVRRRLAKQRAGRMRVDRDMLIAHMWVEEEAVLLLQKCGRGLNGRRRGR